jgi:putative transposase
MIDRTAKLSITKQAELLGIRRGVVYYTAKALSDHELTLMNEIDRLHLEHPFMGTRMLKNELSAKGYQVGRKRIGKLMQVMGIEAIYRKPKKTSIGNQAHKKYGYLLRHIGLIEPNQVWALDTTYIPMKKGFVYLTAVIDWATRKVLAHKTAITLEACHAVDVLSEALSKYPAPEIVNTDQGSQFTADEFVYTVVNHGCKMSMDGKGAWRDNVMVERFWRSVKYERVYLKAYDTVTSAQADLAGYLMWYNQSRHHSSLGHRTPDDVYFSGFKSLPAAV